jgi:hypothetical protein
LHVGGLASPDGIGVILTVTVVNISAESFTGRGLALPSVFSFKLLYFSSAINHAIYFD